MIKGLRDLGLLEVSAIRKRRQRRITLTRLGRKRFARALKAVRTRKVESSVRHAWAAMEQSRFDQWATVAEVLEAVKRYCRGLGDFTELYWYLSLIRGALSFACGTARRW